MELGALKSVALGWLFIHSGGYEGYLEICTNTNPGTQWMPVCGEHWTNTEARVACNQLGYPNTTTLGKYPQATNTDLAMAVVSTLATLNCTPRILMYYFSTYKPS